MKIRWGRALVVAMLTGVCAWGLMQARITQAGYDSVTLAGRN